MLNISCIIYITASIAISSIYLILHFLLLCIHLQCSISTMTPLPHFQFCLGFVGGFLHILSRVKRLTIVSITKSRRKPYNFLRELKPSSTPCTKSSLSKSSKSAESGCQLCENRHHPWISWISFCELQSPIIEYTHATCYENFRLYCSFSVINNSVSF